MIKLSPLVTLVAALSAATATTADARGFGHLGWGIGIASSIRDWRSDRHEDRDVRIVERKQEARKGRQSDWEARAAARVAKQRAAEAAAAEEAREEERARKRRIKEREQAAAAVAAKAKAAAERDRVQTAEAAAPAVQPTVAPVVKGSTIVAAVPPVATPSPVVPKSDTKTDCRQFVPAVGVTVAVPCT
jgi:hypothetical protein